MGCQQPKWRWIHSVRWVTIALVLLYKLGGQDVPRQLLWSYAAAEALWFLQKKVGPKVGVWLKRRRVIREIEQDYSILSRYGLAVFSQGFCQRSQPRQERRTLGLLRRVVSTVGRLVEVALVIVRFVLGGLLSFVSEALLNTCWRLTGQKKKKRRQTQLNFEEGAD